LTDAPMERPAVWPVSPPNKEEEMGRPVVIGLGTLIIIIVLVAFLF
jgi:hypothetical protein